MKRKTLQKALFFVLMLVGLPSWSQVGNSREALLYDQLYKYSQLYTPAVVDTSYSLSLKSGNRAYTGLFEGVNRFFVDADVRVVNNQRNQTHIGVVLFNEKEGPLFQRNKIHFRLRQGVSLSRYSYLILGLSGGVVNQRIGATQNSAGGTANALDLNVGISYLRKRLALGVALQQVTNEQLIPVEEMFKLNNYMNVYAQYTVVKSLRSELRLHGFASYQKDEDLLYQITTNFLYLDHYDFFAGYKKGNGVFAGIGLHEIGEKHLRWTLGVSYLIAADLAKYNNHVLELSLALTKKNL